MKQLIEIANKGQAISSTNYFESELAQNGKIYLSWNAGAARLLLPDALKSHLKEMRSAKEVIVSKGIWLPHGRVAYELLFEDYSGSPYVAIIVIEQSDRLILDTDQFDQFIVSVWTKGGLKIRLPARYRVVDQLPHLQPWSQH